MKKEIEALKEQIEMLVKDDEIQQEIIIKQAQKIDKAKEYLKDNEQLIAIMGTYYYKLLEILGDKE